MKIHTWHGFMYDPDDLILGGIPGPDHPYPFFSQIDEMLGDASGDHILVPHPYFSVPINVKNFFRALWNGHLGCYNWAWDLAVEEGKRWIAENFSKTIYGQDEMQGSLGHSLGSVPALYSTISGQIDRVLLLNGAARSEFAAQRAKKNPHTKFLNICVREDDILRVPGRWIDGKLFHKTNVIGRNGLNGTVLGNWCDIYLDDEDWQEWGAHHGWKFQGDSPKSWGDHKTSYENRDHWPLYRAFFNGELDEELFYN